MQQVEEIMLAKKLDALKKGILTDCTLEVYPIHGEMVKLHAVRRDLSISCPYLASKLASNGQGTFARVQKPHIFELLVEFAHLGKIISRKIIDVDDAYCLHALAKKYKFESLQTFCTQWIISLIKLPNFWENLENTLKAQDNTLMTSCQEFLIKNARECLSQSSFLDISMECLIFVLKQEQLAIEGEEQLLDACIEWFSHHYKDSKDLKTKDLFKQQLLPHLRLLTLDASVVTKIDNFIDDEDQLKFFSFFRGTHCKTVPSFLNVNMTPRNQAVTKEEEKFFTLIPAQYDCMKAAVSAKVANRISFIAGCSLILTGITLAGRISDGKMDVKTKAMGYEELITLTITNSKSADDFCQEICFKAQYCSSTVIDVPSCKRFVPKGSICIIQVEFAGEQGVFKKYQVATLEKMLASKQDYQDIFKQVKLKNIDDDTFEYTDPSFYFIESINFLVKE